MKSSDNMLIVIGALNSIPLFVPVLEAVRYECNSSDRVVGDCGANVTTSLVTQEMPQLVHHKSFEDSQRWTSSLMQQSKLSVTIHFARTRSPVLAQRMYTFAQKRASSWANVASIFREKTQYCQITQ
jgi:hypothetical protein